MDVTGKVVIVTGAGSGIGAALARRLGSGGARVVVSDIDAESVARIAAETNAVAVAGDASDAAVIGRMIDMATSEFGPVDIFFANAGIAGGEGLEDSDERWATTFQVNTMAHVRAARALLPGWLERGTGLFVSTASAAGLLTSLGSAPYAATKHAAVAVAEWLSVTYGERGIKVSCVCPMGVDTPLLHEGFSHGDEGKLASKAVITSGAVLTPDAVAEQVITEMGERFLILPHPEVLKFFKHKGSDYDRWIDGMRWYQSALRQQL